MDNSGINYTDATRSGKRQFVLDETPTLRDQFAMAALTGMLSVIHEEDITWYTKRAYEVADAMMEHRANHPKGE